MTVATAGTPPGSAGGIPAAGRSGLVSTLFHPCLEVLSMRPSREEMQQEALTRAAAGQSLTNWPAIFAGFTAKGIPESDIRPRENIFTYHAWRALGRQVRRGEHGVKVTTFVPMEKKT